MMALSRAGSYGISAPRCNVEGDKNWLEGNLDLDITDPESLCLGLGLPYAKTLNPIDPKPRTTHTGLVHAGMAGSHGRKGARLRADDSDRAVLSRRSCLDAARCGFLASVTLLKPPWPASIRMSSYTLYNPF